MTNEQRQRTINHLREYKNIFLILQIYCLRNSTQLFTKIFLYGVRNILTHVGRKVTKGAVDFDDNNNKKKEQATVKVTF